MREQTRRSSPRSARGCPCRVGGGIRTPARARALVDLGATGVILASSLFKQGVVDIAFAESVCEAVGIERFIAAVDSRSGRVVVDGWRTMLELTPTDAVRTLEPYAGEFLYTHVDREGLMQGTDMAAITVRPQRHDTARHGGRRNHDDG